jgi:cation diffusion facilitator CzcD-associated flavoprotein CzcO
MTHETADLDVALVGAGPYALSLAAHLRAAGVSFRVFGEPMRLWRSHMPAGMFLKSQGFASNLSTPQPGYTLEAFCRNSGRGYAPYGVPVPLETFLAYGDWFQQALVPQLEQVLVTEVGQGPAENGGGYALSLSDGTSLSARRVVVATGVQHFAHVPAVLTALPPGAHSHASQPGDLRRFAGRDVVVVGAGQSALESAALLHEAGATVRVLARTARLAWNGEPLPPSRPWRQRLREPEVDLGSGWATWFYSRHAGLFRYLPPGQRLHRARTALGPAGACWLRPRVEGRIPIQLRHEVTDARPVEGGASLSVRTPDGGTVEIRTEHVIAATGYRPDLARLTFLDASLRARVRTIGVAPRVDGAFESSVPGLHFVGPAVAATFGPLMRFVCGTRFASPTLTRHLAESADRPAGAPLTVPG